MLDFQNELKKILEDDPLNLLKFQARSQITNNHRLVKSFEEINKFIDKEGKEPTESRDIKERKLFSRLRELKKDFEKISELRQHDKYNLFANVKEPQSVDDILDSDNLGILDDDPESIFSLKHISKFKSKTDYVAKRKPCRDFIKYEAKFKQIQNEISSRKRKLILFKEAHLKEGRYYILDGILLFLEKIAEPVTKVFHDKTQGTRKRIDPRTRCIFENGLESDMYLRSLQKELYNNGSTVIESNKNALDQFDKNLGGLSKNDHPTGFIYILSSLSENPKIQSIKNLYKIGYCSTSVEERIKNVKNDTTFLMAPVKIVSSYKTFNLNPQKFENTIHNFFVDKCLDIKIADNLGQNKRPKEWYVVPIRIIEKVIELIINNEIKNYKYEAMTEKLVKIK